MVGLNLNFPFFFKKPFIFWPTGCEIIVIIVNFKIQWLFKTLKRPNSQMHWKNKQKL